MVDFLETSAAAISTIKGAVDLAKSIAGDGGANEAKLAELLGKVVEAHGQALAAQAAHAALALEAKELRDENARLMAWDAEAARYELRDIGRGVMAYVLKEAGEVSPHSLCANCFHDGKKSILQPEKCVSWETILRCHKCSAVLTAKSDPQRMRVERKGTAWSA